MALKFAILADSHLSNVKETAQYAIWESMLDTLKKDAPDLIILLGDLTACGNLDVASRAVSQLSALGIPIQLVYGNSDERTRNTEDEIRQYLSASEPFLTSDVAVKLLECPAGKISSETIADLQEFIIANQDKSIVVGCHYPPEIFEDIPEMKDIFQSGKIDLFLCAHLHYESNYIFENTKVHVVRGLDPDKAIGGPAAISLAEYHKGWSFRCLELDDDCGHKWSMRKKKDFFKLIGLATMDQPLAGFDFAIKNNIENIELRYNHCKGENRVKLKEALDAWRNNGGKILSLHMPDLAFDEAANCIGNEQWQAAAEMAMELSAQRVTVHVPRIANYLMSAGASRKSVVKQYMRSLDVLLDANIQVGIENLHMNPGEIDDESRGFGYTPEECIDFIEELKLIKRNDNIGFCLDIGHARNNPPYSSRISVSQWYASTGHLINAMHLHQVLQKDNGLENHYPFLDVFGSLISLQSLMWAWSTGQIPSCPMFLEMRDFTKSLTSFRTIKNYMFSDNQYNKQYPELGLSVSTVIQAVTPEALDVLLQFSPGPLEINPLIFPDQASIEFFNQWRLDNNIDIASLHVPFGEGYDVSAIDESVRLVAVSNVAAAIEMANKFDAEIIVLHASFEPIDDSERMLRIEQLRKSMDDLAEVLKQNNCRLAIEYLPRTCIGNSLEEFIAIMENMDAELFGVCLDVNHLMSIYSKLPDIVSQLGDRLFSLHISDYDGIDEKHWLPGEGVIDWSEFIASLKSIGYCGPWIYECKLTEDSLEQKLEKIKTNQQWLTEMVQKIWQ